MSSMQLFVLQLPDGNILAGRLLMPPTPTTSKYRPLLVCVHGGSSDAEYFDMDQEHSISGISQALRIPVIAISRPSYGGSTPLRPLADGESWGEQQGHYLNSTILPSLWKEYGELSRATSVVLLAHSIGAMVATVAAGCHTGTGRYPLAGLITSGIGAEHVDASRQHMIHLLDTQAESITFDPVAKNAVMLQAPHKKLVNPRVCEHTVRLNKPLPTAELHDINFTWLTNFHKYSTLIQVPVLYGLGEFDGLWVSTAEAVEEYKSAFPASLRIEGGIVPMAPHCIEMSYQSQGWLSRCFGFASECAVSKGLLSES
ncbi:hypothetical protein N7507_002954 [Penicillium longicatenatum]|nr:hypothetical protein N7507_002954 [Penicillium longicatenatum]